MTHTDNQPPERTEQQETRTPVSEPEERTILLPRTETGEPGATPPTSKTAALPASPKTRFFQLKKRRDVNSVMEELQDHPAEGEVDFSGDEESLELLEESYDVGKKFAEGGQGELFHGFDRRLNRLVALKSLRGELSGNQRLRRFFLSEARVTAQLDHPAIVPIYTLNSDRKAGLHLAMKLVKGQTFKAYLEQICTHYRLDGVNSFDEKKALRTRLDILLKVCDALEYAHSRNVMHCDLKPSNIMIGEFRETYIMDWGIARRIRHTENAAETPPQEDDFCGTPQYLAPEVIRHELRDQRADLFAMGAILFEAATLKTAFTGNSVSEVLANIADGRMEPLEHRFHAPIDADLKAVIRKALAPDPKQRYQEIREFSGDLRRYLMGLSVSARPDNPAMKLVRWCYLHRRLTLVLMLCALLAGVGALAFTLYREFRFSEELRSRDYALGAAYSRSTHAGHLLDEQFSKLELMTASLAADIRYLLKYDPHHEKGEEHAFRAVSELRRPGAPGLIDSVFHHGRIDPESIAYNVTPDTNPESVERRLEPISRYIPRLLQTILESPVNARVTDSNLEELKTAAFRDGTPIIRVLFGFPDGLYAAYPAGNGFPERYDPRRRIWFPPANAWKEKRAVWSRPYIDSVPQIGLVISCSVPLRMPDGRGNGVCAVDISLDELIEELHSSGNAGPHVLEKAIMDDDGRIIVSTTRDFADIARSNYRSPDDEVVFKQLENRAVLDDMKKRKFGVVTIQEPDGNETVYTFCHIRSVNWFYIEKLDMRNLLAFFRR